MTTISFSDFNLSPEIVVGCEERQRLTVLAMSAVGHAPEDSDFLLYELDRAKTVPDHALPPDIVRVGSFVRFRNIEGEERTMRVVLPEEADPARSRISVLSPLGTALLGLRPGQSITWLDGDGQKQFLTALAVLPPHEARASE